MFLNPALAAEKQGITASFNNRTYTNKQISSYSLNQLTLIYPFKLKKLFYSAASKIDHQSGAALSVYHEATGDDAHLNTLGVLISVAHSVQLAKEHFLSLGMQGGYVRKAHDDNFKWGTQYDPDIGYNENITPSVTDILDLVSDYPVFNAGIVWYYKNSSMKKYMRRFNMDAFNGISLYNVNTPNQSFIEGYKVDVPLQFKLHGGVLYKISPLVQMSPSYIYVRQNANNQFNIGTYFSFTTPSMVTQEKDIKALLGVWYRWGDSFILSAGSKIQQFTFAFSYDFNTSEFNYKDRGKGTFEFSLKYSLAPPKEAMQRGLLYPSFL